MAISFGSNAELISSDLHIKGDSRVVLDDLTGLEWLSFQETRLSNVDGSYEERIAKMVAQKPEWRIATASEVATLFLNTFGSLDFYGINSSDQRYIDFRNQFGVSSTFDTHYGLGLYYNNGVVRSAGTSSWNGGSIRHNATPISYNGNGGVYNSLFMVSTGGVTYSSQNDPYFKSVQNVPTPMLFGLLGFSLLGFSKRKKQ